MGGGGFYGYFDEQGLPVGIQECLKGFIEDALIIPAGRLFRNETARMVKVNWRRLAQRLFWWNF